MTRFRPVTLLLLLLLATAAACSPADSPEDRSSTPARAEVEVEERDLSAFFGSRDGTFVLLDPQARRMIRHNSARARTPFIPASTFKIPNTMIALETGVASGPDFHLAWDSTVAPRQGWWPAAWAQDNTLRTALPASVVWFYQEIARRVGPERMQEWLDRLEYGNRDMSGGIDQFWLSGGLRISAEEQVEFLRRFHAGELNVSERSARITRELLLLEEAPAYRLSGKTGLAPLGEGTGVDIGWFVGYVERDGNVYFFATNLDSHSNEDVAARVPITRAILTDLGLLAD